MVSNTASPPLLLARENWNSTRGSDSLLEAAFMICGDAASHALVMVMGEYSRFPEGIPLAASRGELMAIRNCVQTIPGSGRGPAVPANWPCVWPRMETRQLEPAAGPNCPLTGGRAATFWGGIAQYRVSAANTNRTNEVLSLIVSPVLNKSLS